MESKLEWLQERQKGIGGSDVGAILGVNPYKTAFNIYREKTEPILEVNEQSEAARQGTDLEDYVAMRFTEKSGKKVRRDNRHLIHKDYPFMVANIDRRIVGENAILECKTVTPYNSKEWEGEEVPASYMLQCQHYMAVTGADKVYLAYLIFSTKFGYREIKRDEELINIIIEEEKNFWKLVENRTPPALDGSSAAEKWVNERYKKVNEGEVINLNSSWKEMLDRRKELKKYKDETDKEIKEIDNQLKNTLGNAEFGVAPGYSVEWKEIKSKRPNTEKLKKEFRDVYNECLKEIKSRRLTIKEAK